MKIDTRLMQGEDLPQIVAIEQSWTYLSKWGEEGYLAVLRDPRVYACLVAEDVEAEMSVENSLLRRKEGVDLCRDSHRAEPTSPPLPGGGIALSHQPSHSQGNITGQSSIVGFAVLALLIDHCELCNLVVRPAYLSSRWDICCCNNVSRLLRTATSSESFWRFANPTTVPLHSTKETASGLPLRGRIIIAVRPSMPGLWRSGCIDTNKVKFPCGITPCCT